MGNTSPQINSTRSGTTTTTTTKSESGQYPPLKKSRSLREYSRSTSLINTSTRKNVSLPGPKSAPPTDAEIIDICALRCAVSSTEMSADNGASSLDGKNDGEKQLMKQLDYIRSCVRKDKGLFGKLSMLKFSMKFSFAVRRNDDRKSAKQTYLLQS